MTTLVEETTKTTIETELKKESLSNNKEKKIKRVDFLAELYNGTETQAPITSPIELAVALKEATVEGRFVSKIKDPENREMIKYESDVKWYLTDGAKKGLINKTYTKRPSKETAVIAPLV